MSYSINQKITLSFTSGGVPPVVRAMQFDNNMRIVEVSMTANGVPFEVPAGYSVHVRLRKPDGKHVYNPALEVIGNRARILLTRQMLCFAGTAHAILEVVGGADGKDVLGSAQWNIDIAPNPVPEEFVESTDEYKTVQELCAIASQYADAAAGSADAAGASEQAAAQAAEIAQDAAESLQPVVNHIKGDIFYKLGIDKSINLLSYRPLGVLRKGYICLSSDDGTGQLAMYTIPKIKELREKYKKPISVTFAVFSDSSVFKNEEYRALVQEMMTSYYKCSIAIHGVKKFTDYSDDELISYLDTQAEELTALCGVAPTSIVYPEHAYNVKTSTIAGAYYGVCCTGGSNWPIVYDYSTSGERSNLYTLFRYSLFGNSTSFETKKTEIKNMIDYCADNHKICLPFFHDFDFTSDKGYWTKEQCMELFEYCVQYVVSKAGAVEFINIGDIPKLR